MEFENLEFENSEFENLVTENLEFENLETENLDLLADKVKVMINLWALLVKLNNLTFGNKAVFRLESTILDGRPAGLEKLEI